MNIHFWFALLFFASLTPAWATEDILLDTQKIPISQSRQGRNSVIASAQDRDGLTWLASLHALYVFDGTSVRPVLSEVLAGSKISDIHIDADNTLWVATKNGILAYSLTKQSSTWYHTGPRGGLESHITYKFLHDASGTLWVGTSEAGLHRFDPTTDRFVNSGLAPRDIARNCAVFDLCEDQHKNIWIGTGLGLYMINPERTAATYIPLADNTEYTARHVSVDSSGTVWVHATSAGIYSTSPGGTRILRPVTDIPASPVWAMTSDSQGDTWISTKKGLYRFDARDKRSYRHALTGVDQRPIPHHIASITELANGIFIFGTFNGGALRSVPRPAAHLLKLEVAGGADEAQLLHVKCAYNAVDRRLWIAPAEGGLYRSAPIDPRHLFFARQLKVEQVLQSPRIVALHSLGERGLLYSLADTLCWLSPDLQQTRFSLPRTIAVANGDPQNAIRQFIPGEGDHFWLVQKNDVLFWQLGSTYFRKVAPFDAISHVAENNGTLWIAHSGQVNALDIRTEGTQKLHPVPDEGVNTIFADSRHTVWLATPSALLRTDLATGTNTAITSPSGESVHGVLSFWEHPDGDVWMHTQDSIFRVPAGSSTAHEVVTATPDPSQGVWSPPISLPDATLVYGHSEGLLVVSPRNLAQETPVQAIITGVRVFDTPVGLSTTGRPPAELRLRHDQDYISAEFATPGFSPYRMPRFAYKMDGLDPRWNTLHGRPSVSFGHLPPGTYTLWVKEVSSPLPPQSVRIAIVPPWWLTGYAKAGYIIGAALLLYAVARVYLHFQMLSMRQEMLESLVMQDPLTGLPNRRKFDEFLNLEKSRAQRSRQPLSVIMIDIDFFKGFNDTYGHQAGDETLRRFAQAVQNALGRPEDFVARYGGEEFVVVLPNTPRPGAERVAAKIHQSIYAAHIPYAHSPLSDRVTASLGISTFVPESELHIKSGLFAADSALYEAKRSGRNRSHFQAMHSTLVLVAPTEESV